MKNADILFVLSLSLKVARWDGFKWCLLSNLLNLLEVLSSRGESFKNLGTNGEHKRVKPKISIAMTEGVIKTEKATGIKPGSFKGIL